MTQILIVDDKHENRYYLESLLRGNKYEVETAHHGAEALVMARRHKPDIIVSDLLMPVMDGYTLLRRWKSDPELAPIPFIVYTATYTEPEDEQLALSMGADAFILKPMEPDAFLRKITHVLTHIDTRSTTPTQNLEEEDPELLKVYSETLIRKLEEKTFQLEETNSRLQDDIDKRKRIEQSLRDSEERFRQLAENINEVFWISNPDKRAMIYISPAFETIWGRSCQSLYDNPSSWLDAIHPEDRSRVAQAALTKQHKGLYDETYRILHRDKSIRWIRDKAFPVRNEQGEIYRIVGIASDMTERKQLEEQFLRAQRMESIGTLAGGIAHDLNNVLAPIIMGVDFLGRILDDPKANGIIANIGRSARRGSDLVRQVLSFARGVEGSKINIQVAHLLREVETIVNNSFPKNIELACKIPSDLWTVIGDPTQLHQVLLNLCVNARDAMSEHGGKLIIKANNESIDKQYASMQKGMEEGQYVVITVTDNGCGMSSETIARIFDPFFTTKEVGKGTGLGLSSVSGIVRSHGGFVQVESELGQGSTFRVFLPAQASVPTNNPPTDDTNVTEGTSGNQDVNQADGEHILIVDDESSILTITQQTLEAYGYRVYTALDGAHAVSQYIEHQNDIDLVLTDLMMPIMDGSALIAVLHRLNPDLKIIAVSGLNTSEHVAKVTQLGVRHFLPKPFSAECLLGCIQNALSETEISP